MTINVISDLHCRANSFPPSFDPTGLAPADVLVVAGDLGTRRTYRKALKRLKEFADGIFGTVIAIRGNHDFYDEARQPDDGAPSQKDNSVVTVGSGQDTADFICTPMWTPIMNDVLIEFSLNDYAFIPGFTTRRSTELFWQNLEFIEREVARSREAGHKTVVVTHHLPRPELISDNFRRSSVNEAFCVLDESAQRRIAALKPDVWLHGHSHQFSDMTVDGVRYVRNPYGYEWPSHDYGRLPKEDTGFRTDCIVEV